MSGERLDHFRRAVQEASLPDDVRSCVSDLLLILTYLDQASKEDARFELDNSISAIRHVTERALDGLRDTLGLTDHLALLAWTARTASEVSSSLKNPTPAPGVSYADFDSEADAARQLADRASALLDRYTLNRDQEQILSVARAAVKEASTAAERAQESAGISGGASLAKHFGEYAAGEKRAADLFRLLTIGGVGLALAAALAFGPAGVGDWAALTYRLTLIGASGTLAAYFARQASQHRRIYNWAKSLEVQLKSFPAFVEPVPGDERAELYRVLAHRVLSSPPERISSNGDDNIGSSQLIELVTTLAKRST